MTTATDRRKLIRIAKLDCPEKRAKAILRTDFPNYRDNVYRALIRSTGAHTGGGHYAQQLFPKFDHVWPDYDLDYALEIKCQGRLTQHIRHFEILYFNTIQGSDELAQWLLSLGDAWDEYGFAAHVLKASYGFGSNSSLLRARALLKGILHFVPSDMVGLQRPTIRYGNSPFVNGPALIEQMR